MAATRSYYRSALRKAIFENKKGTIGFAIVVAFVLVGLLAPYIAPYDPYEIGVGPPYSPPSREHLLGTNDLGQDIFSRLIYGTRISLLVGFIAGLASTLLATALGILAGYYEGLFSRAIVGSMDLFLVIPGIPLILLLAAYLGPGLWSIILVITLLTWSPAARVIRGQTLAVKNRLYVEAAIAMGHSNLGVLLRHILPSILPIMFANTILRVVDAVLLEAAISFLGLGDPRKISWGMMLYFAEQRMAFAIGAWWWVIPPGLCISLLAIGFSLLAFSLDEAFNPTLQFPTWRGDFSPSKLFKKALRKSGRATTSY